MLLAKRSVPKHALRRVHVTVKQLSLLFSRHDLSPPLVKGERIRTRTRFLRLSLSLFLSLFRAPVSGREKPLLLSFQMAPVLFRLGCSLGR